MKHRILGLLAMTAMILVVFLASAFGPDSPTHRVHQT